MPAFSSSPSRLHFQHYQHAPTLSSPQALYPQFRLIGQSASDWAHGQVATAGTVTARSIATGSVAAGLQERTAGGVSTAGMLGPAAGGVSTAGMVGLAAIFTAAGVAIVAVAEMASGYIFA